MTVADTEFCYGKVFVVQVESCAHLHIGKLGTDGFHGEAHNVGTDGNATQQRRLAMLLLLLFPGRQRCACQTIQNQAQNQAQAQVPVQERDAS